MSGEKKPVVNVLDDSPIIDPVATTDLNKVAADEVFMNELVTIRVHGTTDPNQPPYVVVSCNGVNQPIVRGKPQQVRRKYVEILAHMKETKYQQVQDPRELERIDLRDTTALAYPFEVLQDASPKGKAWLEHVLNEPA